MERVLELTEVFQSKAATTFPFGVRELFCFRGRGCTGRLESHVANVEVFLEAVGLQEIGEFEGADVAASLSDLALEINNHSADLDECEALVQQLVPLSLAQVIQAQLLTGELAIELMSLLDLLRVNRHG
jgi:hypothetical protein